MTLISRKILKARPQELGRIKIGAKGALTRSQGGKEFRLPVKLDHFLITTRKRGDDENFEKDTALHATIGEAPTELSGVLMYATPEENFHAEMTRYKGKKKVWSCNGEEATNLLTGACGTCPRLAGGDCGCKPYMRLHIQLWGAPVFGYHVFRSTGWETTNNIQTALSEIYEQFGTLYRAPVKLVLYPATVNYEEGGQAKTGEAYMVGLVLAMSMEEAAGTMVKAKRLMSATKKELRLISAGVLEEQAQRDVEEEADIAEEFFPEGAVQASVASQATLDAFKDTLRPEPATTAATDAAPVVEADFEIEDEQKDTDEQPPDSESEAESVAAPPTAPPFPPDSEPAEQPPDPQADAIALKAAQKRLKSFLTNRGVDTFADGFERWLEKLTGTEMISGLDMSDIATVMKAIEGGNRPI